MPTQVTQSLPSPGAGVGPARAGLLALARLMVLAALLTAGDGCQPARTVPARAAPPAGDGGAETAASAEPGELNWDELMAGRWESGKQPLVPDSIARLDGQQVRLRGFAIPLHDAAESTCLFVAQMPRGCYFCQPPGIAEVVVVEIAGGRKMPLRDKPLRVRGVLRLGSGKDDDAALYTIVEAQAQYDTD
jgi:hypothetical protein